jgi:hypothetical protein
VAVGASAVLTTWVHCCCIDGKRAVCACIKHAARASPRCQEEPPSARARHNVHAREHGEPTRRRSSARAYNNKTRILQTRVMRALVYRLVHAVSTAYTPSLFQPATSKVRSCCATRIYNCRWRAHVVGERRSSVDVEVECALSADPQGLILTGL